MTRMRIAESGSGMGTTTSRNPDQTLVLRAGKDGRKLTEQLRDNFRRAVRDRVLNRPLQVDEDLAAFRDTLYGRSEVVV